jgi:hypothetical protein
VFAPVVFNAELKVEFEIVFPLAFEVALDAELATEDFCAAAAVA